MTYLAWLVRGVANDKGGEVLPYDLATILQYFGRKSIDSGSARAYIMVHVTIYLYGEISHYIIMCSHIIMTHPIISSIFYHNNTFHAMVIPTMSIAKPSDKLYCHVFLSCVIFLVPEMHLLLSLGYDL